MRNPAAMRIVLLALMLAVSHIALISHVTAHFEPQLEQCELCVSQGQLLSAVPVGDHALAVAGQPGLAAFKSRQCQFPQRHYSTHHQRAPPFPSA
jgi:hypothetical protein